MKATAQRMTAEKKLETLRDQRAKFPDQYFAKSAVNNALRDKRITKPDHCEICASTDRIHGHHHDYSKPLDVWWLCDHCHKLIHRLMRSVQRKAGDLT
jgi:hypothetical protein